MTDPAFLPIKRLQAEERARRRIQEAITEKSLVYMDIFDDMLRRLCIGSDQAPYNMRQWAEFNGDRIEDAAREIARRRYHDRPSEEEVQDEMRGDHE